MSFCDQTSSPEDFEFKRFDCISKPFLLIVAIGTLNSVWHSVLNMSYWDHSVSVVYQSPSIYHTAYSTIELRLEISNNLTF